MILIRSIVLLLVAGFISALSVQAEGLSAASHTIQPGETLAVIAERYGVDINALAAANGISNVHFVYAWQQLSIPTGGSAVSASSSAVFAPSAAGTYTVQRGDTIFSIARRHGITAEALMAANGITDPHFIHSGLQLTLSAAPPPAPASAPAAPAGSTAPGQAAVAAPVQVTAPAPATYPAAGIEQYIVRRGDYLTELGVRFDMEWRILAKLNNVSPPYTLHTGQVLKMPTFAEYLSLLPDNSNYKLFYTTNHHPGARVGVGREIVIEIGRQSIYAYENGVLRKRALMSSGKMLTPTVLGDYEIYLKFRSQTMSGPGYSLDNVEWPMYFYKGYAIHGTWWHTMFGTPMSHGCVNLTNEDARWFWEFADKGTPVHVRY